MLIAFRFRLTALCIAALGLPLCAHVHGQSLLPDAVFPKLRAPVKEKPDKIDILHRYTMGYLAGSGWLDGITTTQALHHPSMAYRTDHSFLMRYEVTEQGWAKYFGDRDATAVVGANALLDLGVEELSHRLYRRGGRWRIAAIALEVVKATDGTVAGIHNARLQSEIDTHVRKVTGYRGAIVWSNH